MVADAVPEGTGDTASAGGGPRGVRTGNASCVETTCILREDPLTKKQFISLGLAVLGMLSMIFVTPEIEGLGYQGKVALGVGIFAVIVWMTQALDDAQSGFCIVGFLVLFGAASLKQALSGYASGGVWIVTLGMIMAACMGESGISRRIALLTISKLGKTATGLYWAMAVICLIMTFFIPSLAAKTLLVLPIITQMGIAFGAEKGQSSMVKGLIFVVTITGTMFCIAVLTSHAANPITVSLLEDATGTLVTWGEWFKIGAPPAIVCGFLAVPIIIKLFPPDVKDVSAGRALVNRELAELGPATFKEKYTLIVFLATLGLWATSSIHHLSTTLVALMSVLAMILPGPQQIMNWKKAQTKVPWNIFIVYGAGLSMGAVLVSSGAASWLASTFFSPLAELDLKLQVVIFIWILLCLQVLFTGGGPKTTALTPVIIAHTLTVAALPQFAGMNVAPFVILVGMNVVHQYLLPVSNLPNIIGLATEEITTHELIKVGAIMSIFGATFMSIMVYTYWSWIGLFN